MFFFLLLLLRGKFNVNWTFAFISLLINHYFAVGKGIFVVYFKGRGTPQSFKKKKQKHKVYIKLKNQFLCFQIVIIFRPEYLFL